MSKKKKKTKEKIDQHDFLFIIAHIPLVLITFISVYNSINGMEFGLYETNTITGMPAFIGTFLMLYIVLAFITIPALVYKIYYLITYC